jgi:hypothetical protein
VAGKPILINLRNLIFMDEVLGEPTSGSPFFLAKIKPARPALFDVA